MGVVTTKYVRKPLYVDAIEVTSENFLDVARWCQGLVGPEGGEFGTEVQPAEGIEIDPEKYYIRLRVHNPKNRWQSMANVGDWILYTEHGYKVYSANAFENNFDKLEEAKEFLAKDPAAQPAPESPVTAEAVTDGGDKVYETEI